MGAVFSIAWHVAGLIWSIGFLIVIAWIASCVWSEHRAKRRARDARRREDVIYAQANIRRLGARR